MTALMYHGYAVWHARHAGYVAAQVEWQAKFDKAMNDSKAMHESQQSIVSILARTDNTEINAKFEQIKAQLEALKKLPAANVPGKSVPQSCDADPERVKWVDEE